MRSIFNKMLANLRMRLSAKLVSIGLITPIPAPEFSDPNGSFDPMVWTKSFLAHVQAHPGMELSETSMLSWFSNALLAGYEHARNTTGNKTVKYVEDMERALTILGTIHPITNANFREDPVLFAQMAHRSYLKTMGELTRLRYKFATGEYFDQPAVQADREGKLMEWGVQ